MSAEPIALDRSTGWSARPSHTGLIGCCAVAAAGLFLCITPPIALGQKIESRFFPVLRDQAIPASSVTRIDRTLCWDWARSKVRSPELLDLDVSLDTADGDTFAPEIYNPENGLPWHKGGALPPGHYETRFCTTIPVSVAHDMPVRLRQSLGYAGFLGLWTLQVPLPSIVTN